MATMTPCNCDNFFETQSQIQDLVSILMYYENVIFVNLGPQELIKFRAFAGIEKERIKREGIPKNADDFLERFG